MSAHFFTSFSFFSFVSESPASGSAAPAALDGPVSRLKVGWDFVTVTNVIYAPEEAYAVRPGGYVYV